MKIKNICSIFAFIPHALKTTAFKLGMKATLRDFAWKPRALAQVSFILLFLLLLNSNVCAAQKILIAMYNNPDYSDVRKVFTLGFNFKEATKVVNIPQAIKISQGTAPSDISVGTYPY